jgi:hypothetical protein
MSRLKQKKPPLWFMLAIAAGLVAVVALLVAIFDPHIPFG